MAIKRFSNYNETQSYKSAPQLPKGAYIVEIKKATAKENSIGQYIEMMCDIAEGEYKDFYTTDYKNQSGEDKKWHCNYLLSVPSDDGSEQDGWTKRRFKTFTEALEDSNPGYHFDWDETKFKGKLIGGLFNMREYKTKNGDTAQATNLAQVCSVDDIRKGTYKLPADKLLKSNNRSAKKPSDDFMDIPADADDSLPF